MGPGHWHAKTLALGGRLARRMTARPWRAEQCRPAFFGVCAQSSALRLSARGHLSILLLLSHPSATADLNLAQLFICLQTRTQTEQLDRLGVGLFGSSDTESFPQRWRSVRDLVLSCRYLSSDLLKRWQTCHNMCRAYALKWTAVYRYESIVSLKRRWKMLTSQFMS